VPGWLPDSYLATRFGHRPNSGGPTSGARPRLAPGSLTSGHDAGRPWPPFPAASAHGYATRSGVGEARRTTSEEARRIGDAIGVDWERFDLEQFRAGMDVEFEHGSHDPQTDVTGDDPITTGKIALAHMKEFPDYYERLERMEAEAKRDLAARERRS
jgi:hypothetical protein